MRGNQRAVRMAAFAPDATSVTGPGLWVGWLNSLARDVGFAKAHRRIRQGISDSQGSSLSKLPKLC